MSVSAIRLIAINEFYKVIYHPIIIVTGLILVVLTGIQAAGGVQDLYMTSVFRHCDGFIKGYGQVWSTTIYICSIMAAFLGVMALSDDRSKGLLNVLLVKPLYRRDVILGKFIGLSVFIFVFLIFITIANAAALSYFYGGPSSIVEPILRISAYTFVLLLDLMLVIGLTMLIGTVFRDILLAATITIAYLSYEWFWGTAIGIIFIMTNLPLTPSMLTGVILDGIGPSRGCELLNTNYTFSHWFISSLPYIVLMLSIVLVTLVINCYVYAKMEDV